MVHTVYKTKNLINGKFYIGVHKTDDLTDGYLGSGTLIKRAIEKYGEESFEKEILFEFDNAEEAFQKEEELVEQHRRDPLSYNIRKGGAGGFDYINQNGFSALGGQRSHVTRSRLLAEDPAYGEKIRAAARRSIAIASARVSPEIRLRNLAKAVETWRGQHHSIEYRERKSQELLGDNNPTRGKHWINLGGLEMVVLPEEVQKYLDLGWMKGRRKRFWVPILEEIAKPRPIRLGKSTQGVIRKSRKKPKSEWTRILPNWPSDDEFLEVVSRIGQRAFARQLGVRNVAVHHKIKKITGT